MNDLLALKNLHIGQLISFYSGLDNFNNVVTGYAIFLGFTAAKEEDITWCIARYLKFTSIKETDICTIANHLSEICNFNCLPFFFSMEKATTEELKDALQKRLAKPCKQDEILQLDCTSSLSDTIMVEQVNLGKDILKHYLLKSALLFPCKVPLTSLLDIDYFLDRFLKAYDERKMPNIDIENAVKTSSYKPRHFYILKTAKMTRLYYCLTESKEDNAFYFVLCYNTKTSFKKDRENMEIYLKNCRKKDFLSMFGLVRFRVIKNKMMYEIQNVEGIKQQVSRTMYLDLVNDSWWSAIRAQDNVYY